MTGKLIYDRSEDRLAIAPDIKNDLDYMTYDYDNLYHLHCGDTLEVLRHIITDKVKDVWIPTRVEHSDDWYLIDLYKSGEIPQDLIVRTMR